MQNLENVKKFRICGLYAPKKNLRGLLFISRSKKKNQVGNSKKFVVRLDLSAPGLVLSAPGLIVSVSGLIQSAPGLRRHSECARRHSECAAAHRRHPPARPPPGAAARPPARRRRAEPSIYTNSRSTAPWRPLVVVISNSSSSLREFALSKRPAFLGPARVDWEFGPPPMATP